MRRVSYAILAASALLLTAAAAPAQTGYDYAYWTCVGPGEPGVDPQEVIDAFYAMIAVYPRGLCTKACKELGAACVKVTKDQEKCGTNFLKSTDKLALVICEGEGGAKNACKQGIAALTRQDIADWKLGAALGAAQCAVEQTRCQASCR